MNYQKIELIRSDVTIAQFFQYIKSQCKKKGIDFGINRAEFENPTTTYMFGYYVKDGVETIIPSGEKEVAEKVTPAQAEYISSSPCFSQEYFLGWDGSITNEICEFIYDNDKTGHGYYYKVVSDN